MYNWEVISPWGCNFWIGGLAYDNNKLITESIIDYSIPVSIKQISAEI